jgi:hypothetical protein
VKVRKDIAVWNSADVLNRDVFGRILNAESYSG